MKHHRCAALAALAVLQAFAWTANTPANAQNPYGSSYRGGADAQDEKKRREEEEKKRHAPPQQQQRQAPPPQQMQQSQPRREGPREDQRFMRGGQDDGRAREDAERRRAAEDAARRKAAEDARKSQLEQMQNAQKAREDAERRRAADEAARRKAAEDARKSQYEQMQNAQKAREDAERRRAADEAPRRKAAEDARKSQLEQMQNAQKAREDADRRRAADEAARRKAAEDARKSQLEQMQNAQKTREDAERRRAADEAARRKAAEDARKPLFEHKQNAPNVREDADRRKAAEDAARRNAVDDARKPQGEQLHGGQRGREDVGRNQGAGDASHRKAADDASSHQPAPGFAGKGRIEPLPAIRPADPKLLEARRARELELRRQFEREKQAGAAEKSRDHAESRIRTQDERLKFLHGERRETRDTEGRVVIREPGSRTIIRDTTIKIDLPGDRQRGHFGERHKPTGAIIVHDETERFRKRYRDVHVERRGHESHAEARLPDGGSVINVTDEHGRAIRRIRRDRDGRERVLFDNGSRAAVAFGLGALMLTLAPPVIDMPHEQYVVDMESASEDDIAEVLSAPPVEDLGRGYTLDEVLHNVSLRQRMRSLDVNTITFDTGAWDVPEMQYDRLEDLADVINRILARHPDEMFLVEGHTDAVGSDEDNLSLSDRRAESVANVLSQRFNVPAENLVTQGYGWHHLKVDTDGPERANRRVTVRRITPLLASGYGR